MAGADAGWWDCPFPLLAGRDLEALPLAIDIAGWVVALLKMGRPGVLVPGDALGNPLFDAAVGILDKAPAGGVPDELVVGFEEAAIDEVVALDAREGEREGVCARALHQAVVDEEARGARLPHAPGARGLGARGRVVAGEAAVVRGQKIIALVLGDG